MLPATSVTWLFPLALVVHVAGVVVWMGAVAYYLFVLRPALHRSGLERKATYPLLVAIKARLRRVVGASIVALVASGLYLARTRGLIGPHRWATATDRAVFAWKMVVVAALIGIFLSAFAVLARVKTPRVRGRLFVAIHVVVLILGLTAAALGVLLAV